MRKFIILLSAVSAMLMVSCEEKKVTTNTDSTKVLLPTDPVSNLKALRDSADKAWALMIQSDDQKISDIGRLLQEISYCKKYNAMLLDSLTNAVKNMKSKRYDQLNMTDDMITKYDEYTDKVIARTQYLAQSTTELQSHPIAETLYNDIVMADKDVVRYRSLYDRTAFEYNRILEAAQKDMGDKVSDFVKLPTFSIVIPA